MKKWIGLCLMSMGLGNAYAGQITLVGHGEVFSPPDRVSFQVSISAQCYPTAKEASQAADQLASELFTALTQLFPKKENTQEVTTQGGYTQPFYATQVGQNTYCQNTFQKDTQIMIKTDQIDKFESLFNQVQDLVYAKYSVNQINPVTKARAFTQMSQPYASLSTEKQQDLEKEALKKALHNAQEKAKEILADLNITQFSPAEISEIGIQTPIPMMKRMPMREGMSLMAASVEAPVSFGDSTLSKELTVIFEY